MKINAAIAKSKDTPLVFEEIEFDEPKQDEVLIKIIASGICHTDAESIKGNGAPFPAVLGHEGAGAVGLSAVMAANLLGLKNIIVVDIHDNRLDLAKELWATHALNSKMVDIITEIKTITDGGVHYGIETTGVPTVIKQAITSLRLAGKISIVGMGGDVTLNFTNDILMEGKTILGTIQGDSTPQLHIPKIIQYFKEGKFPFDKLVKFYDFKDINQAFNDSKSGETIKPIVLM